MLKLLYYLRGVAARGLLYYSSCFGTAKGILRSALPTHIVHSRLKGFRVLGLGFALSGVFGSGTDCPMQDNAGEVSLCNEMTFVLGWSGLVQPYSSDSKP